MKRSSRHLMPASSLLSVWPYIADTAASINPPAEVHGPPCTRKERYGRCWLWPELTPLLIVPAKAGRAVEMHSHVSLLGSGLCSQTSLFFL